MRFQRLITPNEKLYIAGDAITNAFSLQLVVEMTSDIDLNSLNQALLQVSSYHPGANLRAHLSLISSHWVEAEEATTPVTVIAMEWDGIDILISPFTNHAFHPSHPTTQITYIKGTRHFLVFRAFHGVMDSMGVYHWVKDIFRAWRNHVLVGVTSTFTDFEFLKQNRKNTVRPNFPFDCVAPTGQTRSPHTKYLWHKVRLPGKIHALTAKLCQILLESSGELGAEKARFMIPVDLRHHIADANITANFANPIFLDARTESTWQSIYADMVQQLSNHNELMVGKYDHYLRYIPVPLLKFIFKALQYSQKNHYMISGLVSKIVIDLKDLGTPNNQAIDGYFLPIDVPVSPLTLIATESKEATTLCFTISDAHATPADCVNLANRFRKLIADNKDVELFNKPAVDKKLTNKCPQDKTIFAVIWENIVKHGDQSAFISNQITINYNTLRERVLLIASHFYSLGVNAGSRVVILLSANEEAICAMLACWYLGATYIPIDTRTPAAMVLKILADAKPLLVVHEHDFAMPYSGLCTSIPAQITMGELPQVPSTSLSQLAYIIYTSGSTGTPKGVMINHSQLLNYLWWAIDAYRTNTQPYHTALFTSLAFDLTVTTLYLPLITGGSIFIVPERVNPVTLQHLLINPTINFLKLTPSHLRMVHNLPFHSDNPITLVVGGETLPVVLAKSLTYKLPCSTLFNEYGPTETTVGCMIHKYNPKKDTKGSVPIGVPASNIRIYCLDSELKPVANGDIGELYIAGDSVGLGYLNNPAATHASFLKDPFYPHQTMYKSGDLARHRSDGLLIYLGRNDYQVKIHGHRIELLEIETALLEIAGITQAVITPIDLKNGLVELAAYLVSHQKMNTSVLQKKLALVLPYYMVPKYFIFLTELPMTVNGKIDINRLPTPFSPIPSAAVPDEAHDLLQKIRSLFATALSLPISAVSADTSFEAMGGDSLQMAQVISQILNTLLSPQQHDIFSNELSNLLTHATPNTFYKHLAKLLEE